MIPKIIHYCWFGGNPLPESAKKCIASWRKFLPDYEIWQWSEGELVSSSHNDNVNPNPNLKSAIEREQSQAGLCSAEREQARPKVNEHEKDLFDKILPFDVNSIPYTQQAYEAKKYAFVSDYARFWILYKYGGLYFDTDVEVIKPLDDIIERGPFMGVEKSAYVPAPKDVKIESLTGVNPGLGLGADAGLPIYKELLDSYKQKLFFDSNGNKIEGTIVSYTTEVLYRYGLRKSTVVQHIAGLYIYPEDVFCPMDSTTGITTIKDNTVSIHHYDCSWLDHNTMHFRLHLLKNKIYRMMNKIHLK